MDTDASSGGENQAGRIVLGTWGCGAFGNNANAIARLFERALQNNFKSAYHSVTFAIGKALSDWNEAQRLNPSVELRAGVWNDWNLWNRPACLLPVAY